MIMDVRKMFHVEGNSLNMFSRPLCFCTMVTNPERKLYVLCVYKRTWSFMKFPKAVGICDVCFLVFHLTIF